MRRSLLLKLQATAFLVLSAVSCSKPAPDSISIDGGRYPVIFESQGGEQHISITASQNWLIVVNGQSQEEVDWCTVSPMAGLAGGEEITISVQPYDGGEDRSCVLSFVCANQTKYLEVRQTGTESDAYVYFKDLDFKKMILDEYDTNKDRKLSKEEAAQIVRLEFHDTEITSLKGIQSMSSLEYLDCSFNKISGELNLSGLKNLKVAHLHHNLYRSLDVSGCSSLDTLLANDNYTYDENRYMVFPMEEVRLDGCVSLKKADFTDNNLTALDCSDCTSLTDLNCRHNNISELNISNCKKLKRLSCRTNAGLKGRLDLSGCADLEYLECYETAYEAIDTRGCTKLQYVYAHNSSISDVDFNTNTALVHLDLYNNKVASLDVTQNPQLVYLDAALNRLSKIDLSRNPALVEISLGYNSIKSLDLSNNKEVVKFSANSNVLESVVLDGCTKLENLNLDGNNLTSLNLSTNSALGVMSANDNAIKNLDLSRCPVLRVANCERNNLESCNVSGCTELTMLCVESNNLTSLNLSSNTAMQELAAARNQLSDVNITGLSQLSVCELYNNRLERIKLDGCTSMSELYLHNNSLSYLSTFPCESLRQLDCRDNSIKSLDLSNNVSMSFLFATGNPLMTKVYINELSDYNTISVDEGVEVLSKYPGIYDNVSGEWGDDDVDPWK